MQKIEEFVKKYQKKNLPPVQPGDTVKVYEKFFDRNKERVQVFEGIVIAKKHGKEVGATITVRRVLDGVGVEKTFLLHSPTIEKIEIVKRAKVRRAKLYYLRNIIGKMRLTKKNIDVEFLQPQETEKDQETGEREKEENKEGDIETQKAFEQGKTKENRSPSGQKEKQENVENQNTD